MEQYLTDDIRHWLITGDPAMTYLVYRDLLFQELQEKFSSMKDACKSLSYKRHHMLEKGWVHDLLENRNENGHWGRAFYQPKWISSHYTLLDLAMLGSPTTNAIKETLETIVSENKMEDGGINPVGSVKVSDVCINGMFLTYACHFGVKSEDLESVVDYIIDQFMEDGGFNCRKNRSGAHHSSLHSTISVLEGIESYFGHDYKYRLHDLMRIKEAAIEFILMHRLYKSDKTGDLINKNFTMFSYPPRWYYDVLRCLVYFVDADVAYDPRMDDALQLLMDKRRKDGTWPVQNKHAGEVHFDLEKTGSSSRINTYRAIRVLNKYGEHLS